MGKKRGLIILKVQKKLKTNFFGKDSYEHREFIKEQMDLLKINRKLNEITTYFYKWVSYYVRSKKIPVEGKTREFFKERFFYGPDDYFAEVEKISMAMIKKFGHEDLRCQLLVQY
jgi:hypothetical protein